VDRPVIQMPGRACLAGEACDWMGSRAATWSLPGVSVKATAGPYCRPNTIVVNYLDLAQATTYSLRRVAPYPGDYASACIATLQQSGISLSAMRIDVRSSIPRCGGLSSSGPYVLRLSQSSRRRSEYGLKHTRPLNSLIGPNELHPYLVVAWISTQ